MRRPRLRSGILALCLLAGAWGSLARCEEEQDRLAASVKAAFVYNFMKFIEWPALPPQTRTVVLGILGDDPLAEALQAVHGQAAQGKAVEVRRCRGLDELRVCQVAYVGASEAGRFPEVRRAIGRAGVLTVGDSAGFVRQGGVIGFFLEEGRVRFEICAKRAERAGLKVSSQLLEIARRVECSDP